MKVELRKVGISLSITIICLIVSFTCSKQLLPKQDISKKEILSVKANPLIVDDLKANQNDQPVVEVKKEEPKPEIKEPKAEPIKEQPIQQQVIETIQEEIKPKIVYDNMTIEQLTEKLNRFLTSDLTGKGELFATKSLELGVDPYVAIGIVLLETGCKWECSNLVKQCNNVGGQKGSPSCNGGSYRRFPTLDEGIVGFLDNLSRNYYAKGLNTPELMNPKYAASPVWAEKVNRYVESIKAA